MSGAMRDVGLNSGDRGLRNGGSRRWTQGGDETDDRATHPNDFAVIVNAHGTFTLDVAASSANAKCLRYFTADDDGLAQPWAGERVWCNPPYSDIAPWVRRAWDQWPSTYGIGMLLPASRTEQSWWQLAIEPYRDRPGSPLRAHFLPGRMQFLRPGRTAVGPNERSPFGCVLLIWEHPQFGGVDRPWTLTYDPHTVTGGLLE